MQSNRKSRMHNMFKGGRCVLRSARWFSMASVGHSNSTGRWSVLQLRYQLVGWFTQSGIIVPSRTNESTSSYPHHHHHQNHKTCDASKFPCNPKEANLGLGEAINFNKHINIQTFSCFFVFILSGLTLLLPPRLLPTCWIMILCCCYCVDVAIYGRVVRIDSWTVISMDYSG